MRKIDVSERPMPEINPAKVCFIIEKARGLSSEDAGADPDASNPADDGERSHAHRRERPFAASSSNSSRTSTSTRPRLSSPSPGSASAISSRTEWKRAVAEAGEWSEGPTWKYLLGMPLLPDYLEDALSTFGRSCEDIEVGGGGKGAGGKCGTAAEGGKGNRRAAGLEPTAFCNLIERDLVPPPRSRV